MNLNIIELTIDEVIGFNKKAIEFQRQRDPQCQEQHNLIRRGDLESAIRSVFFQSINGYEQLPVERMAGLLLYRISQRQAFENGNKRTALLATYAFLLNHGLRLRTDKDKILSLLNGFAQPEGSQNRKTENDAIQFIEDHIVPR